MLVQIGHLLTAQLLEFSDAANADHVRPIFGNPDGDAGTPEAIATDVPIASVADPIAEAVLADGFGNPANWLVILDDAVAELFDFNVPGVDRAIDERCVRSFAERVTMNDGRLVNELSFVLEASNDRLVGVLTELTLVLGDLSREPALLVEGIDQTDAFASPCPIVVFAVGRSNVHDTRAVGRRDEVRVDETEGVGLVLEIGEERLVLEAKELRALVTSDD